MEQEAQHILHPAQALIAMDPHRFRVACCGRRFGKALDVDTPILTPNGFKPMRDINVGDYVYDEDGNPTMVNDVSLPYTNRECFKVIFSDGSEIIADGEHDWMVESKKIRKNNARNTTKQHPLEKKTTKEIAQTLFIGKKNETNYSIPNTKPIIGEKKNYAIEPYFLGLWLGDGTTSGVGITTVDEEVIKYLYEYASRLGLKVTKNTRITTGVTTFNIVGERGAKYSLRVALKELNLLNNKHMPETLLTASYEQRLELLKGLMDSDGCCTNGFYEYTTIKKQLANDVHKLLCTFGIKATNNEYDSRFYGKLMGKKYRICFSTDLDIFSLPRKQKSQKINRKSDIYRRFIVAVEPVETRPVKCIRVDNTNHQFLAGHSLIPTHNTFMVVDQMKARASIPNSRIAYIAPTYQQARDICWSQLKKECEQSALTINESRLEIVLVNGSMIVLRGWENIDTLRGQQFDLIVIDEIASMRNFWENWHEIIRPTLTDTKGEGIFISTPKGFNHFYDLFNMESKDKDYKSFHFSTYDNPHIDNDEVDKAKEELTEDRFAQEYLADFRKTEGLVYKEFKRAEHLISGDIAKWLEGKGQTVARKYCGVDFGFVHPAAVLNVKETSDGIFYVESEWYKSGKTDAEIAEYAYGIKAHATYPDPANPGGIEELKKAGCNVREVIKGPNSIKNGINVVRELLKANRLFVHESCESLVFEFETYSYGDKGSKMKVDENPVKENDDALDALRYVLMMVDGKKGHNKAVVRKPRFTGFNKRV